MRTPRINYLRHRSESRVRHSTRFLNWLQFQATRLGKTTSEVFASVVYPGSSREVEKETPASKPVNTVAPTITGTAQVGVELTSSPGTWTGNPDPTFTYQWQADGVDIADATSDTYTPVAGDVGKALTLVVTATNSQGSANATSAATDAVIAA